MTMTSWRCKALLSLLLLNHWTGVSWLVAIAVRSARRCLEAHCSMWLAKKTTHDLTRNRTRAQIELCYVYLRRLDRRSLCWISWQLWIHSTRYRSIHSHSTLHRSCSRSVHHIERNSGDMLGDRDSLPTVDDSFGVNWIVSWNDWNPVVSTRQEASNTRVRRHWQCANIRWRPSIRRIGRRELCWCVAIDEVLRVRTWHDVVDGSVVIQVYCGDRHRNNVKRCLKSKKHRKFLVKNPNISRRYITTCK